MNSGITKILLITFISMYLTLVTVPFSHSAENTVGKTLILYYSLTGNTKASCEALQEALRADIVEIKDLVNRSGRWGFFKTAIGSLLGMHTKIEPENPDLSSYPNIILGSPIWTGKLSMATRTLIDKNSFEGKKVVIFTTTNAGTLMTVNTNLLGRFDSMDWMTPSTNVPTEFYQIRSQVNLEQP